MGHHCSRALDLVLGHNYLGTIRAFQFLYLNSVLELCLRIICHTIKAESHGDILQSTMNPEVFQSAWQGQEIIPKHLLSMVSNAGTHTLWFQYYDSSLPACLDSHVSLKSERPLGFNMVPFPAESWCVTLSVPCFPCPRNCYSSLTDVLCYKSNHDITAYFLYLKKILIFTLVH